MFQVAVYPGEYGAFEVWVVQYSLGGFVDLRAIDMPGLLPVTVVDPSSVHHNVDSWFTLIIWMTLASPVKWWR